MIHFDAARHRLMREHNENAWMVWQGAALARSKKLPKIDRLLAKPRKERQTWREHMNIMGQWAVVAAAIEEKKKQQQQQQHQKAFVDG